MPDARPLRRPCPPWLRKPHPSPGFGLLARLRLELHAALAEVSRAFSTLDDDDDGLITRFEAIEWPALTAQFHRGDEDGSASIDRPEFERLLKLSDFGRL